MNEKLIHRIQSKPKGLVFNTACLKVTAGNNYDEVLEQLIGFVEKTVAEKGNIEFFAAPSSITKQEIMLWEVWENQAALDSHMKEDYTKAILNKNIIELKWNDTITY